MTNDGPFGRAGLGFCNRPPTQGYDILDPPQRKAHPQTIGERARFAVRTAYADVDDRGKSRRRACFPVARAGRNVRAHDGFTNSCVCVVAHYLLQYVSPKTTHNPVIGLTRARLPAYLKDPPPERLTRWICAQEADCGEQASAERDPPPPLAGLAPCGECTALQCTVQGGQPDASAQRSLTGGRGLFSLLGELLDGRAGSSRLASAQNLFFPLAALQCVDIWRE